MLVSYQSFESDVKLIMQELKEVDGNCRMCHLLYDVLNRLTCANEGKPFF